MIINLLNTDKSISFEGLKIKQPNRLIRDNGSNFVEKLLDNSVVKKFKASNEYDLFVRPVKKGVIAYKIKALQDGFEALLNNISVPWQMVSKNRETLNEHFVNDYLSRYHVLQSQLKESNNSKFLKDMDVSDDKKSIFVEDFEKLTFMQKTKMILSRLFHKKSKSYLDNMINSYEKEGDNVLGVRVANHTNKFMVIETDSELIYTPFKTVADYGKPTYVYYKLKHTSSPEAVEPSLTSVLMNSSNKSDELF